MRLPAAAWIVAAFLAPQVYAQSQPSTNKPTVVLVHGAFAESSSWGAVIALLESDGYHVISVANPLRGLTEDAAVVGRVVRSIEGKVVLVGHSYGGAVITEAASGAINVKALVYVAGFVPDRGESSLSLSAEYPGSSLGDSLWTIATPDGDEDLYIRPEKFRDQFAADVPVAQAAILAATQRPILFSALGEPTRTPTWKTLPSYMIYGTADRNIPAEAMKFMAKRAQSRKTIAIDGASHAIMISHPSEVAALIELASSVE